MTFIIAEAGSNHNGDFHTAKELILTADWCGADAVKFQAIPPFPAYRWVPRLVQICEDVGVEFMMTPFDVKAVEYLIPYVRRWKIASAELVNQELLGAVARTGKPVILSTGMASEEEVRWAWDQLEGASEVLLLHCVSEYPAKPEHMNLEVLADCHGLSDHSLGTHMAVAAVALSAQVIEKHLTLDRAQQGPDHHYALEPDEFRQMVRQIRDVEKALGDGIKRPMPGEATEARGRRLTWEPSA